MSYRTSALLLALAVALGTTACNRQKQETQTPASGAPPQSPSGGGGESTENGVIHNAGQGLPPVVLPPGAEEVTLRLRLALAEPLKPGDLQLGTLTNAAHPDQRVRPAIEVVQDPESAGDARPGDAAQKRPLIARVSGLIPFGDSTVPVLLRGEQVETLQFHKTGLISRASADEPVIAHENDGVVLLILENPSSHRYVNVKARLRFQGVDSCVSVADRVVEAPPPGKCTGPEAWTSFDAPRFSRVSLRVAADPAWFKDAKTGFARSATRHGELTLLYPAAANSAANGVFQQTIPIDAQFEPGTASRMESFGWAILWLVIGALLSLVLRISIPNYRRKKALKEQLDEARKRTAEVSDLVNSQLRVLLRVERLQLDQMRRDGWVFGPAFADIAARVDTGVAALNRKIALVQRLDAASCRLETLQSAPVAPTRLGIIERNLDAACEGLKSDQLSEADWALIQQRLEAADKALNEPTQEEKQAFEALISQRWKSVLAHFGADPNGALQTSSGPAFFPDPSLLPKAGDADGMQWIDSVGVVRADLLVAALESIRDVQLLAPAMKRDTKWADATTSLSGWLSAPSITSLAAARLLLRQISEGISERDVEDALKAGLMDIEMDPQFVNPNQTVRFSVRFRDPHLNAAAARAGVVCEWRFSDPRMKSLFSWSESAKEEPPSNPPADGDSRAATTPDQTEFGWKVHRYFEPDVAKQDVDVRFFRHGKPLAPDQAPPVTCAKTVSPKMRSHHKKDRSERRQRWLPQALQLAAALLVPLAALTFTTTGEGASGEWWDLVGLGFGSETIRNILTGPPSSQ